MNITSIVQKAFSNARRKIIGRQKGGVITRMVKATKKSCLIGIDPSVPTACWRFDHSKDRHIIQCGIQLDKIANASTNASEAKMKRFIETVIRHETEHGIQTDRTNAVAEQCKSLKIPFSLWNLFEDARIEYNSAVRTDGDGAFRWINFQDVDASYNLASSLFWATKTNEAGIKKQPSASVPQWDGATEVIYQGKRKKTRLVVLDFYRRAIATSNSLDLLPLLIEWIDIFGTEVKPEHADHIINGEHDPDADESHTPVIAPTGLPVQQHADEMPLNNWKTRRMPADPLQVNRISRAMDAVMRNAKTVKNKLTTFGNRLHASQAMQGSEKSFLNRGRTTGKRSVTLIVDMSGSMSDLWKTHGGKEFVLAFRGLAKRNKIDLNLFLTKQMSGKNVSTRVDASVSDEHLAMVRTDGNAEGLMACIKRFLPTIKDSTTTVIFTDAELRDNDIDTKRYRDMGLNAIGCVIAESESLVNYTRNQMNQHFARSTVATNATELARRLMHEILKD
jgi:hypothetical protein